MLAARQPSLCVPSGLAHGARRLGLPAAIAAPQQLGVACALAAHAGAAGEILAAADTLRVPYAFAAHVWIPALAV